MPQVRPFKGILYNRDKVPDLKDVITPPYDVISPAEQEEYHQRHPNNMIYLVLGRTDPLDTERHNRYTRAAESFRSWLDAGILRQDEKPAFYVTEIDFELDGQVHTRFGFIAIVRLEGLESRTILRHEKTFSSVKEDRLRLLDHCEANFSPIFSLFPDQDGRIVEQLRIAVKGISPALNFTDLKGYRHRLWRVTSEEVHEDIERMLTDRPLYIADGHHRYETALRYRDMVRARQPGLDPSGRRARL